MRYETYGIESFKGMNLECLPQCLPQCLRLDKVLHFSDFGKREFLCRSIIRLDPRWLLDGAIRNLVRNIIWREIYG